MKEIHASINKADGDFYLLYSTTGESNGGEPIEPACTTAEVLPIGLCYSEKCQEETGTGALLCLAQECGTEFQDLSTECRNCLLAEGGSGNLDIQAMMEACMEVQESPSEDGSTNGLILISRFPMKNKMIAALPSDEIHRGYIAATLQTSGTMGNIDVLCTQLSNQADGANSATLQAQQIDAIIKVFNEKEDKNIQLLMGDINTSLETDTMLSHNAATWSTLKNAFFHNNWNNNPFCTVCQSNMQIQQTVENIDFMPEYASDHLFYRSFQHPFYLSTFRTYDDFVSNKPYTKSTALSSHYGVGTIISPYPINK
jgi:endonuclease/exonuclease/phosphatase family metal-dependent hydrolase